MEKVRRGKASIAKGRRYSRVRRRQETNCPQGPYEP